MLKKLAGLIGLLLLGAIAYLLLAPVPIEPKAWTPPVSPGYTGEFALNDRLRGIERLAEGRGHGPEGVSLDAQGRVYAGYSDGRIVRLDPASGELTELANTGGHPLGTAVGPAGELYVADAAKGLLQIEEGQVRVLSTSANDVPFRFVDDVDVSADGGQLYFTDASARFGFDELMADVMEHGGTGRLLRYDRASGVTTVLLDGLFFPNGVALGPDDSYLLVTETAQYRVRRYWLKGEKAGTSDVLIENLPGFPDNLSFNGSDRFWLALYAPRPAELDQLLPRPWLRKIVLRLPAALHPKPVMHAAVLGLDFDGKVVANLQDASEGAYAPITSVEQAGDTLYFGSLSYPAFGRLRLDPTR
jgi:sugar lactone lactonase YvrE